MTDLTSGSPLGVRRGWLTVATVGVALVAIPLVVLCLVMVDKTHFGALVGPIFLPLTTGGILVGAVVLIVATWNLPIRRTWRGVALFVWSLIALTSPLFGWLFLFPWAVLVVTLPVVLWILFSLYRAAP